MTAAVVILCVAVAVLAVVLGVVERSHGQERRDWVAERRSLVDRAIARHSGEVLALDRHAEKRPPKDREPPRLVEGLQ